MEAAPDPRHLPFPLGILCFFGLSPHTLSHWLVAPTLLRCSWPSPWKQGLSTAFWVLIGYGSFVSSREGILEELAAPWAHCRSCSFSFSSSLWRPETEVWGSVPSGPSGLIIVQDAEALVKGQWSWRGRQTRWSHSFPLTLQLKFILFYE